MSDATPSTHPALHQRIGLWLGPALALLAWWLLPAGEGGGDGLTQAGRITAAIGVCMATWWMTEALPLPATALLPIVAFPLLGVAPVADTLRPYASDIIFLFMGGFMLGLAMQRWGLHKRLALWIILAVGTRPIRLVAGFMLATAFLSMWISNTAATIILLPVGVSIIAMLKRPDSGVPKEAAAAFGTCLMLAIAYAASIGGSGTLIGSPPNLVAASFISSQYGCEVSMLEWMSFGVPIVAVFLPLAWLYLTRIAYPVRIEKLPGGRESIRAELHALGPLHGPERLVAIVFASAALAWILRPQLVAWTGLSGLTDAVIAVAAPLLLFMLPTGDGRRVLDWDTAVKLPWGILLLFGGGLSLAMAVSLHDVDAFIAGGLSGLAGMPMLLVAFAVAVLVVFLTELTSNTAMATAFVPVVAAVALGLGVDPIPLLLAVGLGASYAFMLPVATPPNAVVFGSGAITIGQMVRAGIVLNLVGVVLVTVAVSLVPAGICAGGPG